MIKTFRNTILLLLSFVLPYIPASGQPKGSGSVVFLAKVTALNHAAGLPVSCGVMATNLLIQYRIERVYVGRYPESGILVDVLTCGAAPSTEMKEGDEVLVVARRVDHIPDEVDSLGLRRKSSQRRVFYRALSIAHPMYAER